VIRVVFNRDLVWHDCRRLELVSSNGMSLLLIVHLCELLLQPLDTFLAWIVSPNLINTRTLTQTFPRWIDPTITLAARLDVCGDAKHNWADLHSLPPLDGPLSNDHSFVSICCSVPGATYLKNMWHDWWRRCNVHIGICRGYTSVSGCIWATRCQPIVLVFAGHEHARIDGVRYLRDFEYNIRAAAEERKVAFAVGVASFSHSVLCNDMSAGTQCLILLLQTVSIIHPF